jgi:hypothetical protein
MSEFKITPKDWNIDGKLYKPGDVLVLEGDRAEIEFHNLPAVTITARSKTLIKATNKGGKLLQFFNCKGIRLTGSIDNKDVKNIDISGGDIGEQAIDFTDCSTEIEIDHIHVHDFWGSAINVKTYPTCDPRTWRENFTMRNIVLRDNLVENVRKGEGAYIGCSHYHQSFPLASCGAVKSALEHAIIGVRVTNNIFRNIGYDGVQVGGAIEDCIIRGNVCENTGTAKVYGQASGIQVNPGTNAIVENNIVNGCTSYGLSIQGRMGTVARHNLVMNTVGGVFAVAREKDAGSFLIENNSFIDILPNAGNFMDYYSNVTLKNNVIHMKTGAPVMKMYGGKLTDTGNFKPGGTSAQLALDASGVPTAESKIPAGIGYADYIKPEPKVTKTYYQALIERVTTDGVDEFFLTAEDYPQVFRKKIE